MTQEVVRSKYERIQPNSRTVLYEGELLVDHGGTVMVCKGHISVTLRNAPQVLFELQYPFDLGHDPLKIGSEIEVGLPNSEGKGSGKVWGKRIESGPPILQISTGSFDGPFEIGDFAATEKIQFLIPNFPSFLGKAVTRDGVTTASKMTVESGEWIIEIDEVSNCSEFLQVLKEEGGIAITHIGEVRRVNGKDISYDVAESLTEIFHWWLSFIRGERTGPLLMAGIHHGEIIWERWRAPVVHSWRDERSWLPTRRPIDGTIAGPEALGALFQYMFEMKKDQKEFEALVRAIDWYTQSVHERHIAAIIVLAQAGIELMSWLTIVHDAGISEEGFEKLNASDQLRMALSLANIDRSVPLSLAELGRAAEKSKTTTAVDGPGSVTEIRNAVIHPKKKDRFDDFRVMLQGGLLAIHYLELLILHRSGYRGLMMDRTNFSTPAAFVPWV